MQRIKDETKDMKTGVIPDVVLLQGLQGELVDLYHRLGEDLAQSFSAKELAILDRKVTAAKYHLKGRMEFSMTQEDARQDAIKQSEEEYRGEIRAMETYEHSKILRDSLSNAFSYLQQVISTIKLLEGKQPSPSQS